MVKTPDHVHNCHCKIFFYFFIFLVCYNAWRCVDVVQSAQCLIVKINHGRVIMTDPFPAPPEPISQRNVRSGVEQVENYVSFVISAAAAEANENGAKNSYIRIFER